MESCTRYSRTTSKASDDANNKPARHVRGNIKPTACPKWEKCSAPICPLDEDWRDRVHRDGDRVCFYLTEYAKKRTRRNLRGVLPRELFEAIAARQYSIIAQAIPLISKRLKKAAKTGSRLGRRIDQSKTNSPRREQKLSNQSDISTELSASSGHYKDPYTDHRKRSQ